MAFDYMIQGQGPQIDISLFGNAAVQGAQVAQLSPSPWAAAAKGITAGVNQAEEIRKNEASIAQAEAVTEGQKIQNQQAPAELAMKQKQIDATANYQAAQTDFTRVNIAEAPQKLANDTLQAKASAASSYASAGHANAESAALNYSLAQRKEVDDAMNYMAAKVRDNPTAAIYDPNLAKIANAYPEAFKMYAQAAIASPNSSEAAKAVYKARLGQSNWEIQQQKEADDFAAKAHGTEGEMDASGAVRAAMHSDKLAAAGYNPATTRSVDIGPKLSFTTKDGQTAIKLLNADGKGETEILSGLATDDSIVKSKSSIDAYTLARGQADYYLGKIGVNSRTPLAAFTKEELAQAFLSNKLGDRNELVAAQVAHAEKQSQSQNGMLPPDAATSAPSPEVPQPLILKASEMNQAGASLVTSFADPTKSSTNVFASDKTYQTFAKQLFELGDTELVAANSSTINSLIKLASPQLSGMSPISKAGLPDTSTVLQDTAKMYSANDLAAQIDTPMGRNYVKMADDYNKDNPTKQKSPNDFFYADPKNKATYDTKAAVSFKHIQEELTRMLAAPSNYASKANTTLQKFSSAFNNNAKVIDVGAPASSPIVASPTTADTRSPTQIALGLSKEEAPKESDAVATTDASGLSSDSSSSSTSSSADVVNLVEATSNNGNTPKEEREYRNWIQTDINMNGIATTYLKKPQLLAYWKAHRSSRDKGHKQLAPAT